MINNNTKCTLAVLLAGVLIVFGVLIGRLTVRADTPNHEVAKANTMTDGTANTAKAVVMAVEAIRPSSSIVNKRIQASGVIAGEQVASVGSRISGVAVMQVLAEEGQWVKAGQVLAVLDNQSIRQNIAAALANLRTAQAALAKAQADLHRGEPLIKIEAISREQYDSYQTAVIQAQNDVTAAQANLNNVRLDEQNSQVIAPVSGIISQKNAEVGMMATGAALFTIIKGGVLEWQASVATDEAASLRIGQEVRLHVGQDDVLGAVSRISPIANASRELTVHATLPPQAPVVGGTFVAGEIVIGNEQALMIPARVVSSDDGYDYVWTLTATDTPKIYTANKTKISVQVRQKDQLATDLPADTLIVKSGGNFLSHGDSVKLVGVMNDKPLNTTIASGADNPPTRTAQ
ncbi:MAG: efflux RND transporter periplasmic adaptor subunit [Moraxella sp.]|nr:efflux RND transporter periplasmic adaptor subunit [Moraxella sp.]